MAADLGKLTAVAIKAATPGKLFDGGGLFLDVRANGSRYWRMKYRHGGKERLLSFGVYPEVSLSEARQRRDAARRELREGLDPGSMKRSRKLAARAASANSFQAVADAWLATQKRKLAAATFAKSRWLLDQVVPWLGSRPIGEIEPPELLTALKRIEARGANETAHRTKDKCGQVFRYAIAHGIAKRDPSADLRGALAPIVRTSRAAITDPAKVGTLLRVIDTYSGQHVTRCALRIAPLLFVRPGELRAMEWAEVDLEAAIWRIQAHRMKMREEHVVPLASQAIAILRDLLPLTGSGRYVFPSLRTPIAPMSENTINSALRSLGYDKDTMTGHGFRAMASTRLNELGWQPDVIERQLAHAQRNKVRAAYNRAQYLAERSTMMQAWADYLDALRSGSNVVAIKAAERRRAR
jgi:integrase